MSVASPSSSLSVVIPVRDGATTLGDQLDALCRTEPTRGEFEVVVADNGSTDATRTVAMTFAGRLAIRVVDASHRAGANAARNVGVSAALSDRLVFCDADDEIDSRWLSEIEAAFDAGGRLLGGLIDYSRLNDEISISWRGNRGETVMKMYGFLPAAHFANMAMTRDAFDQLGGLDETFVHGGDDVEFLLAGTAGRNRLDRGARGDGALPLA